MGGLIPFDKYSKQFSQIPNLFTIFFLDCCREPSGRLMKTKFEKVTSAKGIVLIKYSCVAGQKTDEVKILTEEEKKTQI